MTDGINFNANEKDRELANRIAGRATAMLIGAPGRSKMEKMVHHRMNIIACHLNGCPIDLQRLLDADDFNFQHDIIGIDRHIDRDTGRLLHHFRPRFAARETMPGDDGRGADHVAALTSGPPGTPG